MLLLLKLDVMSDVVSKPWAKAPLGHPRILELFRGNPATLDICQTRYELTQGRLMSVALLLGISSFWDWHSPLLAVLLGTILPMGLSISAPFAATSVGAHQKRKPSQLAHHILSYRNLNLEQNYKGLKVEEAVAVRLPWVTWTLELIWLLSDCPLSAFDIVSYPISCQ